MVPAQKGNDSLCLQSKLLLCPEDLTLQIKERIEDAERLQLHFWMFLFLLQFVRNPSNVIV
jgi:hypothetical protein